MTYEAPYELLVGTYGWDDQEWAREFYSEDTPVEWYFLAYSNDYRSVMVPASIWAITRESDIGRWVEESDPDFIFTLELPKNIFHASRDEQEERFAAFIELIAPIKGQTAGFFLNLRDQETDLAALEGLMAMITQHLPVCVDLPASLHGDQALPALLQKYQAGVCWHCDTQAMPEQSGNFIVALSESQDLKRLRTIIETLGSLLEQDKRAALYFEGAHAPDSAWQARIIAELMGV